MQLTDRDVSIIAQVAFKEASRFYDGSPETVPTFIDAMSVMTDALIAQVKTSASEHVTASAPAPQRSYDATAALQTEMGATPINIQVVETAEGGQQGPLPEWFIKAAAEKGVTKVFDNRHRLAQNAKTPWFKSADDRKIPFWPPQKKNERG